MRLIDDACNQMTQESRAKRLDKQGIGIEVVIERVKVDQK